MLLVSHRQALSPLSYLPENKSIREIELNGSVSFKSRYLIVFVFFFKLLFSLVNVTPWQLL
jgi:hypothetical protein